MGRVSMSAAERAPRAGRRRARRLAAVIVIFMRLLCECSEFLGRVLSLVTVAALARADGIPLLRSLSRQVLERRSELEPPAEVHVRFLVRIQPSGDRIGPDLQVKRDVAPLFHDRLCCPRSGRFASRSYRDVSPPSQPSCAAPANDWSASVSWSRRLMASFW